MSITSLELKILFLISPSSVCACEFSRRTDGFLSVEQRLRGRLLRRDVAVRHGCLEVADLTVDVEAQA